MMKKSTSTIVTFFVTFVLLSATYSVNSDAFAQNTTDVISDIPPEEPLLPTTDEVGTMANATDSTSMAATATNVTSGEEEHSDESAHAGEDHGNATSDKNTVTRDSQTVLLEDRSIPEGSFIHLYDSTPYKIMSGHIAAKIPCNDDNSTGVNVLIGQAPDFQQAELDFVPELSSAGDLCLYHVDIASDETATITDVAIQNNSTEDEIDFPPTSTVIIGVNEIAPIGGEEHSHNQ